MCGFRYELTRTHEPRRKLDFLMGELDFTLTPLTHAGFLGCCDSELMVDRLDVEL